MKTYTNRSHVALTDGWMNATWMLDGEEVVKPQERVSRRFCDSRLWSRVQLRLFQKKKKKNLVPAIPIAFLYSSAPLRSVVFARLSHSVLEIDSVTMNDSTTAHGAES